MKRILAIPYLIALLYMALVSCDNEPVSTGEDSEIGLVEPVFYLSTRADTNGDPEDGDAYTLVSYNVGGATSNYTDKNQITNERFFGYYAFDASSRELVPVAINFPVIKTNPTFIPFPPFEYGPYYAPSNGKPLVKEQTQGQRLPPTPETGLNSINTGLYRTAVIHPAIPFYNASDGGLGYLAVYHIDTDVWASSPDDADGNPDTDDPFQIQVRTNREVYSLPDPTELFPVKSFVNVSFYSEYFSDDDPGMTTPKTQKFSITSLKLVNVGSNGWYNARTGVVYPNYNYGPVSDSDAKGDWRTIYALTEKGVKTDGSPIDQIKGVYNYFDLVDPNHDGVESDSKVVDMSSKKIKPPKRDGFPDPKEYIQWSVETPVFPSDYRGGENGGLSQVVPLSLRMVLSVGGAQLKATVPIAIVMECGKSYNFYVNVMSELIGVFYTAFSWNLDNVGTEDDPDEIGGVDESYYFEIDNITYDHKEWQNGGGGNSVIDCEDN